MITALKAWWRRLWAPKASTAECPHCCYRVEWRPVFCVHKRPKCEESWMVCDDCGWEGVYSPPVRIFRTHR